jgi:hypothetical protein
MIQNNLEVSLLLKIEYTQSIYLTDGSIWMYNDPILNFEVIEGVQYITSELGFVMTQAPTE